MDIFTPFHLYRKRVWSSALVLKETETQEGVLIITVTENQKMLSPEHDVNIYLLCIWDLTSPIQTPHYSGTSVTVNIF